MPIDFFACLRAERVRKNQLGTGHNAYFIKIFIHCFYPETFKALGLLVEWGELA